MKVVTNMRGFQKWMKKHPRKNLTGFFNFGGEPMTHDQIVKVVNYAVEHGYETEADIPCEEIVKLLDLKDCEKMKANELMIGDWVCLVDPDTKKRMNTKVRGVDLCGGGRTVLQWFEPIPLTPEILEKNGFTRYGQVYANLQQWVGKFGDKRKSFVQDIRTGEWGMNDVWINYVHELQHVLKLCKIEKEIEL